jgi:hypothetical protein
VIPGAASCQPIGCLAQNALNDLLPLSFKKKAAERNFSRN